MTENTGKSGHIATSDGVRLHYLEAGSGKTLVMIPGWSQTAAQFKHQIAGLQDRYRLIALDMRGHGESDKPAYGYRIARLAKDLHDVLVALDLREVALLGHSMGCSVIWSYWDLFGAERLARLILVDQMPFITANPAWSQAELEASGAVFTAEALYGMCNALAGPDGLETTRSFVGGMVSSAMSSEEKAWMIERNLRLPRIHAATLLYNHATQDWRDLIPRITLPTLIVGGRGSLVPWKSQVWIHEHIPGSRLEIFEEHEGGKHFMFVEGAEKFNRILAEFLG
ncbi:alpha/beta hydrolase [uncultured Meiothermus sp.]|jgi:pimeloyl-ACP methyl ester carboxylesterase|uniref:alpha/beta fold hydrolase n=1 Tax=uncultured Meiothermus sp. TaxID=157471 RepID=UPI002639FDAF|nr:alpha/beta hydrolase [uncultured Meiothermus sp.]